jgi:hypothetical protein
VKERKAFHQKAKKIKKTRLNDFLSEKSKRNGTKETFGRVLLEEYN